MSQTENLYALAHNEWVPRWFELFYEPETGSFHERLDAEGNSKNLPRRLVTQCRQIIVYALSGNSAYKPAIERAFEYIEANFSTPHEGGYIFAENDPHIDLYALSFLLSACAAAQKPELAARVISFINMHMREAEGFSEKIHADLRPFPQKRRQNPHMHLLEAVQSLALSGEEALYTPYVDELLALFEARFYQNNMLYEFFDSGLQKADNWIEAGHHAEWIWLLSRTPNSVSNTLKPASRQLYQRTLQGWDPAYGGFYNAQKTDSTPVDTHKRIWVQLECLRAARIMGDVATENKIANMLASKYLPASGLWVESWNQDFSQKQAHLPGTTPYHIYPLLASLNAQK